MGDEKESLRGKPKSWSADLFGCFSNPLWCFITTFLPCVTSIRIGLRLGMITSVVIFVIALFVFSSCETMTSGFASTYNRYQRRKKLNIGDEEDNEYKLGIAITGLTVSMVGLLLATIVIAVIQFRFHLLGGGGVHIFDRLLHGCSSVLLKMNGLEKTFLKRSLIIEPTFDQTSKLYRRSDHKTRESHSQNRSNFGFIFLRNWNQHFNIIIPKDVLYCCIDYSLRMQMSNF